MAKKFQITNTGQTNICLVIGVGNKITLTPGDSSRKFSPGVSAAATVYFENEEGQCEVNFFKGNKKHHHCFTVKSARNTNGDLCIKSYLLGNPKGIRSQKGKEREFNKKKHHVERQKGKEVELKFKDESGKHDRVLRFRTKVAT